MTAKTEAELAAITKAAHDACRKRAGGPYWGQLLEANQEDWIAAVGAALEASAADAKPSRTQLAPVYLVVTGLTHEGQELYTRHDVCPPLCDAEKLYPDSEYISDLEYEINRLQTLLQAAKKARPEPTTFSDSVVREKGRLMHASGRSHASQWNEITHLAAEFGRASYLKGWRAAERAHNKNQKENP